MNYIKQLERDLADLKIDRTLALLHLVDLQAYLSLEKFHDDTTVQVADVLRRLEPIKQHLFD